MQIIQAVPTNIITGFLGVGKTTAINHLLKSKPADERWAVLVNEFGEVGVDASILSGQNPLNDKNASENSGVFIKEVAGGCMCCTSGLPMQIALNVLLAKAKPHRLLIEPTGLGHPAEVLETLSQPHYERVISLGATISLVDARNLQDARYTSNDTFNEQLQVADVIVGNKADLYEPNDITTLKAYCEPLQQHALYVVEQAALNWEWLTLPNQFHNKQISHSLQPLSMMDNAAASTDIEKELPACGYIQVSNQQDEFTSVGWRFSPKFKFCRKRIAALLMNMDVERAKAVLITPDGVFGYNKTSQSMTELPLDECMDSRIEIISSQITDTLKEEWEQALLAART